MLINLSLLRRNPNFTLLYTGQVVSFAGTMITGVALPWQIYHLTHSVVMIGLLSLFQLLPLLFTALLGGVLADRYPRRKMLLTAECILACGCLILMWNAGWMRPSVILIFIAAMIMSSFNGLHRPALESLTQQIVAPEDYPAASALTGLKFNLCLILAPALGGLLIAHAGLVVTYLIDFVSFAASMLTLVLMRSVPSPAFAKKHEDSLWTSLKEGLRYAGKRQELLGSYLVDFVAMVFGMPTALFPVIAQSYGGAEALGLLYSAPAVGALVVSVFSGWTARIERYGMAIALSATGWGTAIIFFGLAHQLIWVLFFLALSGAFDQISGIFRQVLWNKSIPNQLRGRLAGIEMISYLSGPKLGDTEASLVASAFGVTASILSGGVLCVVGVLACCWFLPGFRRYPKT